MKACERLPSSKDLIKMDCRAFVHFSCSLRVTIQIQRKETYARFANLRCRDSNNLVVTTSFLNCLTLRRVRCSDSSCVSSFEVQSSIFRLCIIRPKLEL